MSARDWRAVREGDTHSAVRRSANKTPESFIVGVGASGILLAGAAITFVTLVGLVSFNVWPAPHGIPGAANIELGAATPKVAQAPPVATASVSGAPTQLASAVTPAGVAGGGAGGVPGLGSKPGGGGHHGGGPRTGIVVPTVPTPSGPGNSNGNGQGNSRQPSGSQGGSDSGGRSPGNASKGKVKTQAHGNRAEVAQVGGGHGNGSDDESSAGQSGKHQGGPPGRSGKNRGASGAAPGHSSDSAGHGRGHGPKRPNN